MYFRWSFVPDYCMFLIEALCENDNENLHSWPKPFAEINKSKSLRKIIKIETKLLFLKKCPMETCWKYTLHVASYGNSIEIKFPWPWIIHAVISRNNKTVTKSNPDCNCWMQTFDIYVEAAQMAWMYFA